MTLVATAALAVAGCSSSSSGSGGKTTIKFSYLWTGQEAAALQKVIADFNRSQDKIVVKGVSNPDQQAQLAGMTSANGAYDISDSFGSNTGAWASKGILEPLDGYISKDHYDLSDFVPAGMDQVKYQNKVYAMPIALHTFLLLYNKTLFAQAGISGPPKTMSELATDIGKLTKTKSGALTQLGFGSSSGVGTDYTTLAMAMGGHWYQSGKPTPDDPANVQALSFYVDNVTKKYGVGQVQKFASGFGDYQSPQNPFFQGKLAMVVDGEWQSAFIKDFAPKLDWGVAPIPYPDGRPELAGTSQVTSSILYIPRHAPNKEQAWEFMKYLESSKAMAAFTQALTNLPARTSLLSSPSYQQFPNFSAWLDELKSHNLQALPSLPSYAQYIADLNDAYDAVNRLAKTPQKALASVAARVKSYD